VRDRLQKGRDPLDRATLPPLCIRHYMLGS
jgi:hypothetical protein